MTSSRAPVQDIALFPLPHVLFPDGRLNWRVLEPRHLALICECSRQDQPFGVCFSPSVQHDPYNGTPSAIGTLAKVVDFFSHQNGLLRVCLEGTACFRVEQVKIRDNGLLRGEVTLLDASEDAEVPPEFSLLVTILERLAEKMKPSWQHVDAGYYAKASWVGFRLAELLPLDDVERQQLLEISDPLQRLAWLRDTIPRFQRE